MQPDPDLLDVKETCRFFGGTRPINAATLYRGVHLGRYPAPIRVGANSSRWLRSECEVSLAAMVARRAHHA
jgi:predicted DNA-binding transcriptional regulator AlpA